MSNERPRIGWREWVSLPGLGVSRVKAKVDTGARSSALHAQRLETEQRPDGLWVLFDVHPAQRSRAQVVTCSARVIDQRAVKNSGGQEQQRFVIETPLRIGNHEWPIELTLTARDAMGFRMLLGRTAVRRRFLVDPGRSYLLDRPRVS